MTTKRLSMSTIKRLERSLRQGSQVSDIRFLASQTGIPEYKIKRDVKWYREKVKA